MTRHLPEFTLVIASLSLLAACGGSGSGDSSAPSTPSSPPTISFSGPTNAVVGDAVDFAVASPTGHAIVDINWQVSGVSQQPLSAHTQAIGFDVTSSGSFDIAVNVSLENGTTLTDTITLQTNESSAPIAALR
jgi:hypothetical protein